jgi:ParB family transcriptional regulator, chromosome partitioning protein
MRMPPSQSNPDQLSFLEAKAPHDAAVQDGGQPARRGSTALSTRLSTRAAASSDGRPLVVPLDRLDEDLNNPRTEFRDEDIDELADDIRQRGILQPLVVHPADPSGRYRVHFGAKRLRAARRAGLDEVPVVVRDAPADAYAQVAENQKRHGLTPLDLARLIRAKVDEGESNAAIAKRLVMDPTNVAHHLALLDLPPELDNAMKSGRCTSPRTLYELSKLHHSQPEKVRALIAGESAITRVAIAAADRPKRSAASLLELANSQCARLEQTLTRIKQTEHELGATDLAALRHRVADLTNRSA